MKTLQSRVKKLLEQHKLSITQAENKANLFKGAIWNIVSGRYQNPNIQTIIAIAKLFDCSVDSLLFDRSDKGEIFPKFIDPKKFTLPLDALLFNKSAIVVQEAFKEQEIDITLFLKIQLETYFYFLGKNTDPDPDFVHILMNKIS